MFWRLEVFGFQHVNLVLHLSLHKNKTPIYEAFKIQGIHSQWQCGIKKWQSGDNEHWKQWGKSFQKGILEISHPDYVTTLPSRACFHKEHHYYHGSFVPPVCVYMCVFAWEGRLVICVNSVLNIFLSTLPFLNILISQIRNLKLWKIWYFSLLFLFRYHDLQYCWWWNFKYIMSRLHHYYWY